MKLQTYESTRRVSGCFHNDRRIGKKVETNARTICTICERLRLLEGQK